MVLDVNNFVCSLSVVTVSGRSNYHQNKMLYECLLVAQQRQSLWPGTIVVSRERSSQTRRYLLKRSATRSCSRKRLACDLLPRGSAMVLILHSPICPCCVSRPPLSRRAPLLPSPGRVNQTSPERLLRVPAVAGEGDAKRSNTRPWSGIAWNVSWHVCCFVLLTRGWGRLETRPPVALGSSPELFAFTMSLAPPVHPSPIFLTDTENL